ncbi:hypothetical protein [Polaromonas sp. YR568]|uniref:AbiJ-NTD4 domain-containing protein n=1 Tax=Polaromonas sp. YR568 TaxID=1855301 RepID=UPI003137DD9F
MRFSQRIGLSPATKLAQRESIDDELRNSLWSLLTLFYWNTYRRPGNGMYGRSDFVKGSNLQPLLYSLWLHYFKKPIDTIEEYWEYCLEKLRKHFFAAEWYEVYDFIEFIAEYGPAESKQKFVEVANSYLELENSAYRFLDGRIVEITSAEEIEEVEAALQGGGRYPGVQTHLKAALALLSDRKSPDYRNSIKESISAVESLAKQLAGSDAGTLGAVLKTLEKAKKLHPAMKNAFSSLYGYSSDADGIRHALLEESNLTKADARFMLVCCSAFINYSLEAVGA